MEIIIQPTESLTGTPLISIWFGDKQVILDKNEFKNLKEEISLFNKKTAPEVPVQEQQKCAYLGCNNIGTILDDVEVATGITEKQYVCKDHVGQLMEHVTVKSKFRY